jgi:hypothetical protein
MIGSLGLRAILLDPVPATDDAVLMDDSEVSDPASSTCSKEDPGVPDGEPSLSLCMERFATIRGSEDVLEEACLGS